MAQERDTWAGFGREGALFSLTSYSDPSKEELPTQGGQTVSRSDEFPLHRREQKVTPGRYLFSEKPWAAAAVGTRPDTSGGSCYYLNYPQQIL